MEPLIFTILFVLLALYFTSSGIKIVPQGRQYTVERFGKYTRTLSPGIAFLVPFADKIGRKISMMETVLDVPRQEVITRDNAMVGCDAVVFTQVIDAAKAAYEVENLNSAIINLSLTNLRTVIGSMELDEVLSKRDEINARLLDVIDAATTPWGIKVVRIEIKDLSPPADISNSMARQMKAERDRRADIIAADGDRQAQVLRAEGSKQAAIMEAEGRREAAFRDAEARERSAEAEAKATEMVSNSIRDGDVNALNYFIATKYVEAFKELASSPQQRTVIVPAEFAGLVGTLEGIKALTTAASTSASQLAAGRAGGSGRSQPPPTSVPPVSQG
jgi:regulator of protease activity HflC (stomatin/prohibitin superfamily)